ncbi:hypothetical protein DFP73DRAFT_479312 [Morchella snyderi]|nr:hypothetical protein DFP73DRAFT_479312 [Morchella snyderi]
MSQHLKDSATGQSLARLLVGLGCEVNTTWYPALPGGGGVVEWRVAKWRRKVTAEWDEARALFVPLPVMRVADERHLLVYLTAQEFWQLAEGAGGVGVGVGGGGGGGAARLAEHVQLVSGFSAGTQQELKILYLLEGVEAFMRKNRNNKNREYQNRVRAALGEGPNIPAKAEIMDEDVLQDALLELQVVHGCLVHHTASGIESAEWISKFTTDISTIPYKNSRSAIGAAGFCTDAGQLRVGIGRADTFRRMLEEVYRVTPSAAEAVVRVYPDVRALVAAFAEFGEEALADLPILTMRGGKATDKTVGPSTSRKIFAVFTNRDPDSVEI